MEEDEDAFLYGESTAESEPVVNVAIPAVDISLAQYKGISAGADIPLSESAPGAVGEHSAEADAEGEDEQEEDDEEDDDESDIEIILNAPVQEDTSAAARSRDFRSGPSLRGSITKTFNPTPRPSVHLTTEYIPRERGAPVAKPPTQQAESTAITKQTEPAMERPILPKPEQRTNDTSTSLLPDSSSFPVAIAPPSAPPIDPSATGEFSGISIYDVDLQSLSNKAWRRPGSDLSDWFNYGFDEISWEAYCARRREMETMGTELKANVMNLAGMSEEMLQNSVPPELRSMLIAQSARMGIQQQQQQRMNFHSQFGGPQPQGGFPMQMMHPGMGMGPSDMMGVGLPPQMGMGGPGMGMGVAHGIPDGSGTPMHNNLMGGPGGMNPGQAQQVGDDSGVMQQPQVPHGAEGGFPMQMGHFSPQSMGLSQGVGGDFTNTGAQGSGGGMQDSMVGPSPIPSYSESGGPSHTGGPAMRGRGRGIPSRPFGGGVPLGPASARPGANPPMGRGQFTAVGSAPQMLPKRPASPLPPNVPTGPRNQMPRYKDKDRDGGLAQVDGLDYGGNGGGSGNGSGAEDRDRDPHKDRHRERDSERDREKGKERERDRDRDRDGERDKEKERGRDRERDKERDSERDKHRDDPSRKKEKTPPFGPRKDADKDERERRSREERRSSRDERRRDSDDKSISRKRPHSEDHERDSRSLKRR